MKSKLFIRFLAYVSILGCFGLAACGENEELNSVETPENSTSGSIPTGELLGSIMVHSDTSNEDIIADTRKGEYTVFLPQNLNEESNPEANPYQMRFLEDLKEYTGLDVSWEVAPLEEYYSEVEKRLLGENMPDVMLARKRESFYEAAEAGKLWDLTEYLDEYDNLAAAPSALRIGASYNGRVYGIPKRTSDTLKQFLGYRADWLEKLNLKEPTDWESFSTMLYAFTYNDPDGNGKDDTVGLAVDFSGQDFDVMEIWFGVPNVWGIDEEGNLVHKSRTKEYRAAYRAFRQLYTQGVINNGAGEVADFRETNSDVVRSYMEESKAGSIIHRQFYYVRKEFLEQELITEEENNLGLRAYVDTGHGALCYAGEEGGLSSMIVISTESVETEEKLRRLLQGMNDFNDELCEIFITWGWKDETYFVDEEGNIESASFTKEQVKAGMMDFNPYLGLGDLLTGYHAEENLTGLTWISNEWKPEEELVAENEQYCVPNYGIQYISETENEIGKTLDAMLLEAEWRYITGEIDDAGFETALDAWWEAGGEAVTKEKNEKLHEAGN